MLFGLLALSAPLSSQCGPSELLIEDQTCLLVGTILSGSDADGNGVNDSWEIDLNRDKKSDATLTTSAGQEINLSKLICWDMHVDVRVKKWKKSDNGNGSYEVAKWERLVL